MSKGFTPWTPGRATQPHLDDVIDVVFAERDEWPLSQRYWLYKLMAAKGWSKVDEYKKSKYPKAKQLTRDHRNLNNILDRARRAGLVPWEAVASKRGEVHEPFSTSSAETLADDIEWNITNIQFDRQAGQERRVVLWCETEGLVPLVERVTKKYGATLLAGKGFDVIGRKHDFAEHIAEMGDVLILHMGDLDKSGHSIPVALEADLRAFIEELGGEMELKRIALTEQQVHAYNLEYATVPVGTGLNAGNHGKGFTCNFECQLEAMKAVDIRAIASAAFEEALDMGIFNKQLEFGEEERLRALDILRDRLVA